MKCNYLGKGKQCEMDATYECDSIFNVKLYYCTKHKNKKLNNICLKNFKKLT